jgi:hypothetical protein
MRGGKGGRGRERRGGHLLRPHSGLFFCEIGNAIFHLFFENIFLLRQFVVENLSGSELHGVRRVVRCTLA